MFPDLRYNDSQTYIPVWQARIETLRFSGVMGMDHCTDPSEGQCRAVQDGLDDERSAHQGPREASGAPLLPDSLARFVEGDFQQFDCRFVPHVQVFRAMSPRVTVLTRRQGPFQLGRSQFALTSLQGFAVHLLAPAQVDGGILPQQDLLLRVPLSRPCPLSTPCRSNMRGTTPRLGDTPPVRRQVPRLLLAVAVAPRSAEPRPSCWGSGGLS